MTVQEALRDLGITRNYRGYLRAVTAIELALEKEDRLDAVIKGIYSEVARRRDCSWSAVERSLRTLVQRVWRVNRALLIEMVGNRRRVIKALGLDQNDCELGGGMNIDHAVVLAARSCRQRHLLFFGILCKIALHLVVIFAVVLVFWNPKQIF